MYRLVILDESEAVASAFSLIADEEGFQPLIYHCPYQAINRMREGGIDLLLSDCVMDELSGLGVAAVLREEQRNVDIILMSTVEQNLNPAIIEQLRIREFFVKSPGACRKALRFWVSWRERLPTLVDPTE